MRISDQTQCIISRYRDNAEETMAAIAKDFGISAQRVTQIIAAHERRTGEKIRPMRMSTKNQNIALRYRDSMISMEELAIEFGITSNRVSQIIRHYEKHTGVKFVRTLRERVLTVYPSDLPVPAPKPKRKKKAIIPMPHDWWARLQSGDLDRPTATNRRTL